MLAVVEVTNLERVLSDRARRGEEGAFGALVVQYQDRAYRLAWRMAGNESDAEDIVQDAFLHAHRAIGSFHGDSRFGTWLYRIVVNEVLMWKRSAARRPTLPLEETSEGGEDSSVDTSGAPSAEHLLAQKRTTQQVRDALDVLDDAYRTVLVLRDLEGLSSEDVAEILGVNPETVRQRARRARLKLRGLLGHLANAA